ncbi:glycosyltransferase family 4 protein [Pontiella agarivorans]|uniref:Glycosyltransferase family 4 protein n=1 Tax=Pontiella agarivorans TaxID=3038953 RepID=A0ABU5MUE5_9BACT|nr:glycosyltransferase family 4 protein [Pontiella agarivorans]MDZ8117752.1 glycosyltransferase family 4 protein [Pontiella agarivorans]
MKVLFYFGVFARIGGIEEFTKDLASVLCAHGMDVSIVCASLKSPILDEMERVGVKVKRIPFCWGCRWNLPDFVLFPFALYQLRKADVVVHQKPFKNWFYKLFSRKPKHVYITAYRPGEQFRDAGILKDFFSRFDHIFTQATLFKGDLRRAGVNCSVSVLPYTPPQGISFSPLPFKGNGVLRIAMMGRVEPQKNPVYAIEIVEGLFHQLKQSGTGVEFHVYGSGTLLEEAKVLADQQGVTVSFHGAYQRKDVPSIVAENDCFLISSVSEGQCIVALEVLAGGRPLFATAVGALPDILCTPARGALIPQGNSKEAVSVIQEWLEENQPISPESILESYKEDYDRETVANQYADIFRDLVGKV